MQNRPIQPDPVAGITDTLFESVGIEMNLRATFRIDGQRWPWRRHLCPLFVLSAGGEGLE